MGDLARILKALSNETRLNILAMLRERGELCECEFVGALGITQSKASRHLRELSAAGLVSFRRRAVWIYFSIQENLDGDVIGLLASLEPWFRKAMTDHPDCCHPDGVEPD